MKLSRLLALLACLAFGIAEADAQAYFGTAAGPPVPGAVQMCITAGVAAPCAASMAGDASAANQTTVITALGAKGDSAATDSSSAWSSIALLKGLYAKLAGTLAVSISGTPNVAVTSSVLAAGAATSANQSSEIAALGAPSDPAWTSGSGSLVALLKALYAAMVAATPAGEQHIGEVGGNILSVTAVPTVTASSAYASGNAVGGLITIAGAGRVAGGSGYVQNISIRTKSAQTAEIDVILFRDNPTASTCTDKTALSVAVADFDKVIAPVLVTQWMSLGTPSVGYATNLALAYQLPTGATALYACLVTRGTPTYTLASDVSAIVKLVRN